MIEKQFAFIWCWGMLRWSLDLDRCTSRLETPVWEAETHKAKCQFFSLLEVTFTLAVNETKQQRVIKADVFIQGFYRKLISWGMQSCAKLIGGSWHSCREAEASESYRICIYIHNLLCVSHKTFNSNTFFFLIQILKKVRMWSSAGNHKVSKFENIEKPAEVICPVVTGW